MASLGVACYLNIITGKRSGSTLLEEPACIATHLRAMLFQVQLNPFSTGGALWGHTAVYKTAGFAPEWDCSRKRMRVGRAIRKQ